MAGSNFEWSTSEAVEAIPVSDRLPLIYQNQSLRLPAHDPLAFMELCTLPIYRWSRERAWDELDRSIDLLLRTLPESGRTPAFRQL